MELCISSAIFGLEICIAHNVFIFFALLIIIEGKYTV